MVFIATLGAIHVQALSLECYKLFNGHWMITYGPGVVFSAT